MPINYDYKIDDRAALLMFSQYRDKRLDAFRVAIARMMRIVALAAVSDHMTLRAFDSAAQSFGGRRDDKLHVNTARLMRSLTDGYNLGAENSGAVPGAREGHRTITVSGGSVIGEIGSRVPYAAIHEYGGTVTPKAAKYLSIPVGNLKGSPRQHDGLHAVFPWGNGGALMDEFGKVQYLLRKKVTIPARPYLAPALRDNAARAPQFITEEMSKLIKKIGG